MKLTYIVNFGRVQIIIFGIILGLGSLLMLLIYYKENQFAFILALFMISLLFLKKKLIQSFTKEAQIKINEYSVCITTKKREYEEGKINEFSLSEVKFCKLLHPSDKFKGIKFIFKNNKSVKYIFYIKKLMSTRLTAEEILNEFHSLIKKFNLSVDSKDKIVLKPSFYSSKISLFIGIINSCLFMLNVVLDIIYRANPINLFLLFGLTITFWLQRKAAISYEKKFNA